MIAEAEAKASAGVSTAVSGAATAWAFLSQASDAVFGVPVQVLLACAFGSSAARTYVESTGALRTIGMIAIFTCVGAYSVPLLMHLFGLPTTASAAVGMTISGAAQLPAVRGWVIDIVRKILERKGGIS